LLRRALVAAISPTPNPPKDLTMEHTLPPLPYAIDALAPHYSQETLELPPRQAPTTPTW